MLSIRSLVKITTLEVMMFSSLTLTAQAIESSADNSPSSANSPILISQRAYGTSNSIQYESDGDEAMNRGYSDHENQKYQQAYEHFRDAADNYRQCYQEMRRTNDPRAEEVAQRYHEANNNAKRLFIALRSWR